MATNNSNTDTKKEHVIKVLSAVNSLPSVPFVIYEVTKVIEDPLASATQLGDIISKDQGLVTKVLSVANSPLYGIPRRVATIDFAIVILGFNHIKNIVIALSMMETVKKIGDKNFDQKKYWMHSIMTASTAKRLADDLGYHASGEAFTAGLLHDLGLPIINKCFNKEYVQILETQQSGEASFETAESELLGMTHGEVGKFLIDKWNLPLDISDVVHHHHKPSLAENNKQLVALVHFADYIVENLMEDNFEWDADFVLDESIIEILSLGDREYLDHLVQGYKELFESQINTITN